ncbi:MAG: winged helix-turn-helix transcriptional regulator [Leptolyngbyaceae cyanobacterium SL_5_9]|nr:winged helix-turn-helix transcriptional regulator [Leptolyngbyaceae cyanobacterium SL_5_9]NJO74825.1 winged helix-turn-helix transcriptional regulator [Leptolyngbyaceae cyanobacterium RM1_406_9]
MDVLYLSTQQGQQTRDRILAAIAGEMTRDEIAVAAGLTYEQVRRQTNTLVNEGLLISRRQGNQRYYSTKSSNFKSVVSA